MDSHRIVQVISPRKNSRHDDGCCPSSLGYQPEEKKSDNPGQPKKDAIGIERTIPGVARVFLASKEGKIAMIGINRAIKGCQPEGGKDPSRQ